MFCAISARADWGTYVDFECAITNALYSDVSLFCNEDMTSLSAFASSCPWTNAVLSAKLVQAISTLEQYDGTPLGSTYNDVMSALSNLWQTASPISWQGYCAGIIQSTDYTQKGNFAEGLFIATNLLAKIQNQPWQEPTDEIWKAVRFRQDGGELSIRQSLDFAAALGFEKSGNHTQAIFHATGLPESLLDLIFH